MNQKLGAGQLIFMAITGGPGKVKITLIIEVTKVANNCIGNQYSVLILVTTGMDAFGISRATCH